MGGGRQLGRISVKIVLLVKGRGKRACWNSHQSNLSMVREERAEEYSSEFLVARDLSLARNVHSLTRSNKWPSVKKLGRRMYIRFSIEFSSCARYEWKRKDDNREIRDTCLVERWYMRADWFGGEWHGWSLLLDLPARLGDHNSALSPSSRTNAFPQPIPVWPTYRGPKIHNLFLPISSTPLRVIPIFDTYVVHLYCATPRSVYAVFGEGVGQKWLTSLVIGPSSSAGPFVPSIRTPNSLPFEESWVEQRVSVSGWASPGWVTTTRRRRRACIGDVSSIGPGSRAIALEGQWRVINRWLRWAVLRERRPRPSRSYPIRRSIVPSRTFSLLPSILPPSNVSFRIRAAKNGRGNGNGNGNGIGAKKSRGGIDRFN